MATQNLRALLEALSATPGVKNLGGEVRDVDSLLSSGALAKMDAQHRGIYALFVFDPVDTNVTAYLTSGSLANDTGKHVLALYQRVSRTAPGASPAAIVEIAQEDAMVSFARALFPRQHLALPGLVFAERLAQPKDCIYVPLKGKNQAAITQSVREIVAAAVDAALNPTAETSFAQSAGLKLARTGHAYVRSEGASLEEGFTKLLRMLWANRSDLIALIPIIGKVLAPKAKDDD